MFQLMLSSSRTFTERKLAHLELEGQIIQTNHVHLKKHLIFTSPGTTISAHLHCVKTEAEILEADSSEPEQITQNLPRQIPPQLM